jgi:hypothetical protein
VLGQGIFQISYCWILKPSGIMTNQSLTLSATNVAALVVGIAVIDARTRKITTTDVLGKLAAAFPATQNTNPASIWTNSVDALVSRGIPRNVAQAVRVFERTYYVDK